MNPALTTQLWTLAFQAAAILLPIVLAALLAWLHTALAPYLHDKRVAAWATVCVQYAEQWLDKAGPAKATAAAQMFSQKFPGVPPDQVKALLEAAVLAMKQQAPAILTAGTTPLEPATLQPSVPPVQRLDVMHHVVSVPPPPLSTASELPATSSAPAQPAGAATNSDAALTAAPVAPAAPSPPPIASSS